MAFYNTCPLCRANLDPGEICDCQDRKEQEEQQIKKMIAIGKSGQFRMVFEQGVSGIAENTMV